MLILGAFALVGVPGLHVRVVAPSLDLVLDTVTTVVTLSVAVLGWVRFRQRGEPVAAFQAAAFLVLAIANGLTVMLVITGLDVQAGMALAAPGQAPLYVFTIARIFAAALLVLGSMASLRTRRVDHAPVIVLGSAVTMLLLIALVEVGADRLPSLGSIGVPALPPGAPGAASLPSPTPLGATAQVLAAALFLWAAAPVAPAVPPRRSDRRRVSRGRPRLRRLRAGRSPRSTPARTRASSRAATSCGWRST